MKEERKVFSLSLFIQLLLFISSSSSSLYILFTQSSMDGNSYVPAIS